MTRDEKIRRAVSDGAGFLDLTRRFGMGGDAMRATLKRLGLSVPPGHVKKPMGGIYRGGAAG